MGGRITLQSGSYLTPEEAWSRVHAWLLANGFVVQDLGSEIVVGRPEPPSAPEPPSEPIESATPAPRESIGASTVAARMHGRIVGLQILDLEPTGILAAIGLREGDTVLEWNGEPIDTESRIDDLLRSLTHPASISLHVRGADGQERLHCYEPD